MELHPVRWWLRIAPLVVTLGSLVALAVTFAPSPDASRPAPRAAALPSTRASARGTRRAEPTTDAARDGQAAARDGQAGVRDGQVLHYAAGDPDALLDVTTSAHPLDPGRSPWVLVVHGGSWIRGGPAGMVQSADDLAAHGYVAFRVEYPLVNPRTTFAQQFAGLVDSWRWIRRHARALGLDRDRGAVWGFSAGGHLAAMLGNRVPGIRAVITMSGVLEPDLLARIVEHQHVPGESGEPAKPSESNLMLFLHIEHRVVRARWDPRNRADVDAWRRFSPATYLSTQTPPTLVVQGLADDTVPPKTAALYARALAAHGVPYDVLLLPGVGHDEQQDAAGAQSTALEWLTRYDAPIDPRGRSV